jgi:ribose transport system substrate-binding protein
MNRSCLAVLCLYVFSLLLSGCSPAAVPAASTPPALLTQTAIAPTAENPISIGLVLPETRSLYYQQIQREMQTAAVQAGLSLQVWDAQENPARMAEGIANLAAGGVKALVLAPLQDAAVSEALRRASVPIVSLENRLEGFTPRTFIYSDPENSARKMSDFVCKAMHERGSLAFLAPESADNLETRQIEAERAALQADCPQVKIISASTLQPERQPGQQALLGLLQKSPEIKAVYAAHEALLLGALDAARQAGRLGLLLVGFGEGPDVLLEARQDQITAAAVRDARAVAVLALQTAASLARSEAAPLEVPVDMTVYFNDPSFSLPPDSTAKALDIGVVLPDTDPAFFGQVFQGIKTAARSLDGISLYAFETQASPERMAAVIHDLTVQKVHALLVAPLDDEKVTAALKQAEAQGIPIFLVGLGSTRIPFTSYAGSDPYSGGYQAAEYICGALAAQGTVIEIQLPQTDAQADSISRGFSEYMRTTCRSANFFERKLEQNTQAAAEALMKQLLKENLPVSAVFAPSDTLALGAAAASADLAQKPLIVGYGATPQGLQAVKAGVIRATLGQQAVEMGQIAMETVLEHLYGRAVDRLKPFPLKIVDHVE